MGHRANLILLALLACMLWLLAFLAVGVGYLMAAACFMSFDSSCPSPRGAWVVAAFLAFLAVLATYRFFESRTPRRAR